MYKKLTRVQKKTKSLENIRVVSDEENKLWYKPEVRKWNIGPTKAKEL